jgi:hypothetical protein
VDDRRHHRRLPAHIVVELERADGSKEPRIGVTRDGSTGGFLLGCGGSFEVGETIVLSFQGEEGEPDAAAPLRRRCEIVRCEKHPDPPSALWRYVIAVRFLDDAPELEAMLEEKARVLAESE